MPFILTVAPSINISRSQSLNGGGPSFTQRWMTRLIPFLDLSKACHAVGETSQQEYSLVPLPVHWRGIRSRTYTFCCSSLLICSVTWGAASIAGGAPPHAAIAPAYSIARPAESRKQARRSRGIRHDRAANALDKPDSMAIPRTPCAATILSQLLSQPALTRLARTGGIRFTAAHVPESAGSESTAAAQLRSSPAKCPAPRRPPPHKSSRWSRCSRRTPLRLPSPARFHP